MYKLDLRYIFLFERSVDAVFKLFVDCYINFTLDEHHIVTMGLVVERQWIT